MDRRNATASPRPSRTWRSTKYSDRVAVVRRSGHLPLPSGNYSAERPRVAIAMVAEARRYPVLAIKETVVG